MNDDNVPQDTQDTQSPQDGNSTQVAIDNPVDWMAPEYYSASKNKGWYVGFVVIVLVLILISIFLLKSWSFAILTVVMAVALIIYSLRPAPEIKYTLSVRQGLYIGDKLYNLQDYKYFSVIQESEHNSIMLIPVKRFSPGLSVYFPVEVGERVVDILASRLPMEDYSPDLMDKVISKLKI